MTGGDGLWHGEDVPGLTQAQVHGGSKTEKVVPSFSFLDSQIQN